MKPTSKSLKSGVILAIAAAIGAAGAEPVMRDVVTHDQLVEKLRAATNHGPAVHFKPSEGADPTKVNKPSDIVSQSDFLSFAGRATLVPKHAILHIPPRFADRIKFKPGSKVQTWAEFYAMNRAWITTVEVSRQQAKGAEPLAEELRERFQKAGNVVVATYKTGPISVLPPKAPVETTATETP